MGIGDGDWGMGIGDWGLGPIPNPQSPIPNPQSPNAILLLNKIYLLIFFQKINNLIIINYFSLKIDIIINNITNQFSFCSS